MKKKSNLVDKLNDSEDFEQNAFIKELKNLSKDHQYSFVLFHLDLVLKQAYISRVGRDLNNLIVKKNFDLNSDTKHKESSQTSGNLTTSIDI